MAVHGVQTNIHFHHFGNQVVEAAAARKRNTTIVIGADQAQGVLLLDIDVQKEVCADAAELIEQLELVIEALRGKDPLS